jgi:hypothetical protein
VVVVKNQYFGDTRDLFKYDLVLELLLKNDFLKRFTFIPMLTENVRNFHGRRINYDQARAGTRRKELCSFLAQCVMESRRNIIGLERFFKSFKWARKIDFTIYRKNEYFSHEARTRYFNEIDRCLLSGSAILVDPDIGLAVKSMGGREDNYITYSEVELLFNRMDRNSVLVIFQFIPRVERESYFSQIGRKLKTIVNSSVLYISDSQIAFFILTKNDPKVQRRVVNTIAEYGKAYGLTIGKV